MFQILFRKFTFGFCFLTLVFFTSRMALANNLSNEKLIVAGDSWGQFLCLNGSFQKALKKEGYENVEVVPCIKTTRMGAHAEKWFRLKAHRELRKVLRENPSAKHIYLSIGGNDFLNRWRANMNIDQENEALQKISNNIQAIIADIQSIRPDIQIIVGGYDIGNFKDYSKKIKAYNRLYERMGKPDAQTLQAALIHFTELLNRDLSQISNVSFIHHIGLAHYYDGNNKDCGLKPGQSLAPELISTRENPLSMGGIMNCWASPKSMLSLFGLVDAYHPSMVGFDRIAEHTIRLRFPMN